MSIIINYAIFNSQVIKNHNHTSRCIKQNNHKVQCNLFFINKRYILKLKVVFFRILQYLIHVNIIGHIFFTSGKILYVLFILKNNTVYVNYYCCYHQSIPAGKPNFVFPSLAKLDWEGLRCDTHKYTHNMPKTASDAWQHWLNKVEVLVHIPVDYECPVVQLKNAQRAPSAAQISPLLAEMRNKETQCTQEVSKQIIIYLKKYLDNTLC